MALFYIKKYLLCFVFVIIRRKVNSKEEMAVAHMHGSFYSQALKRQAELSVLLPDYYGEPGAKKGHPIQGNFPVLYLLHGYNSDHSTWSLMTQLAFYVRNLPLAIVMPSGYNSYYANSHSGHLRYFDYLTEELPTLLHNWLSLSNAREDTFIGGLSMGGFGSLVNGLRHPEIFGCITALSSALIKEKILHAVEEPGHDFFTKRQYETMFGVDRIEDYSGSVNDYEALADSLKDAEVKPKIYMACGTEDSLFDANVAFKDRLIADGFDLTWEEGPGVHNWAFWDAYIEKAINWLPLGDTVKGVSSENVGIPERKSN